MSTTKSLPIILNEAFALWQKLIVPIALGAVIIGLLMAVVNQRMISGITESVGNVDEIAKRMEAFGNQMEDINRRLEAGDTSALDDMKDLAPEGMPAPDVGMIGKSITAAAGGGFVLFLLSMLANAYMTVVLVKKIADPVKALSAFAGNALSLILLWIWIALRSFVWIPLIGWIIAIVIGPRFVAAPIIMLEQGKGVMESANVSWNATMGAWFRIVLPCLAAGIGLVIISMIIGAVVGGAGGIVALAITSVIGQLLAGLVMAVAITVARDVLASPSAKVVHA